MTTAQVQVWDFRMNEDSVEKSNLITNLDQIAKQWVFQLEAGEETGYRHWQGRMTLFKVKRKPELMELMRKIDMEVPNYLMPTSTNATGKRTFSYVMKADTRVDGPFKDTDKPAFIPVQYQNIELYPYQEQILKSRLEFDFRVVDCIVDSSGNNGKSTIASIADLRHGCIDLPWINDADKLISSLCDILIAKQERNPGIIFLDMPRALNKEKLHSLYTAIEQMKKGKVWDMRNSYKEWWFNSPRIWVFTNAKPDTDMLSLDRWRFWQIRDKMLMPA